MTWEVEVSGRCDEGHGQKEMNVNGSGSGKRTREWIGRWMGMVWRAGHLLSRIYNCTKHGNRPIENVTTAHLHCTFRFYNCINCDQLHVIICPDGEYREIEFEEAE